MNKEIEVFEFGTDERKNRALILDSKLNDALLDTFIFSAEMVDRKLYKELGFETAKDYFQAKSVSLSSAYRYAQIGRTIKPYLSEGNNPNVGKIVDIGTSKLEQIFKSASEQIPTLFSDGKITLGDEEYSTDDLQEISFRELDTRLKSLSKKVAKNELLEEQKKSAELERDALLKEQEQYKKRDQKYREVSDNYDAIERDIVDATEAFAQVQKYITRIDGKQIPIVLQPRLKTLIQTIQNAGVDLAELHMDVMLNMDEEL